MSAFVPAAVLMVAHADPAPARLVVVTLNTHSFQEGPESPDKLRAIGEGLGALGADVVGLQEVMSGPMLAHGFGGVPFDGVAIVLEALEQATGAPWYAHRFGWAHWDQGEEMSNVVLSRYPIVDSGHRLLTTTDFWPAPREQRAVVYARVELPQRGPVNLFVAHAWGWDSADTLVQVAEVKAFLADRHRGDEVLELLVGDLNTPVGSPAYAAWLAPPFPLVDTWARAGAAEQSTQADGAQRIDYVLASTSCPVVGAWRAFDGEEHAGLTLPVVSDHYGVVVVFDL